MYSFHSAKIPNNARKRKRINEVNIETWRGRGDVKLFGSDDAWEGENNHGLIHVNLGVMCLFPRLILAFLHSTSLETQGIFVKYWVCRPGKEVIERYLKHKGTLLNIGCADQGRR